MEASTIRWNSGFRIVSGKGGVFVIDPSGKRIDHFVHHKAELIARFWHTDGPGSEDAEEFLRTWQRLVFPLWNEVLVDLAHLGVVDIPHDAFAAHLRGYESLLLKRRLPEIKICSLPSPGRLLPGSFVVVGGLSALVALLITGGWLLSGDRLSRIARLLLEPEALKAFIIGLLAVATVVSWRTGGILRRLLHDQMPAPILALIVIVPAIRRRYPFAHLLSRFEKLVLACGGFVWLGFSALAGWGLGGLFSPSIQMGVLLAVLLYTAVELLPFWYSDGALFVEALSGQTNLRKTLHNTLLHQWLPRRSALQRDVQSGESRFFFIAAWGLISLIGSGWLLGVLQQTIMNAPVETMAQEQVRGGWIVLWLIGFLAFLGLLAVFLSGLVIDYIRLVRPLGYKVLSLDGGARNDAAQHLGRIPLFYGFGDRALGSLLDRSQKIEVPTGHYVIREGELGNSFFLLLNGEVEILKAESSGIPKRLAVLGAGSGIGEIALLRNVPRTASVRALGTCEFLMVAGPEFLHWLKENSISDEQAGHRIRISQVLGASSLLRDLPPACSYRLANQGDDRILPKGEVLINEGDHGETAYLIVDGSVSVTKGGNLLATLAQGDVVGEMALLSGKPRSATVTAEEETRVLEMGAYDFWDALEEFPEFRQAAQLLAKARRQSQT